jgi:hypothetical protein
LASIIGKQPAFVFIPNEAKDNSPGAAVQHPSAKEQRLRNPLIFAGLEKA